MGTQYIYMCATRMLGRSPAPAYAPPDGSS
jgi:hypothetical protein